MIVYAAIDVRGGRVVQLVGGDPDSERVSLPDPARVARQWIDCGFAALHVVDLDAALGAGDNRAAVEAVLAAAAGVPVQVGGGVRTTEHVESLLTSGAAAVVVGTRAITEPAWLEEIATRWPDRVVVAADVRGEEVVVHGWTTSTGITAEALLTRLAVLPLAAILVTDVSREGRMGGVDIPRFRLLAAASAHPLLASGGIAGPADLEALSETGVAGAVVGMALYTGALDAADTARGYRT